MLGKTYRCSFESLNDFSAFYVANTLGVEQVITSENALSGNCHKAEITSAGVLHRAYPTFQFQKTPLGSFQTPCLMQFSIWLDVELTTAGQWFSPLTWTPGDTDAWGEEAIMTVGLGVEGYLGLTHVPTFGLTNRIYQASDSNSGPKFPMRQWVNVAVIFYGTYSKVFQDGVLVSHAQVVGRDPWVTQIHAGLYAHPDVEDCLCYNDDLLVAEIEDVEAVEAVIRSNGRIAMSIGNTFENDLLKLIFNATAIANIADNAASSPLTNLYISLHTADPGEAGDQTTSETSYTGYARVAVARTSGGWTVTNNQAVNAATISFGACTVGTPTITYASVGTAASSTGKILFSGALNASLAVSPGVTPSFAASALTISLD